MRIVDCHGHIFPPLAGACGFASADEHLLYLQYAMHTHGNQPVVRRSDGATIAEKHLWAADDPSESGRVPDLNFRVDGNGRMAWEFGGETYHIQYLSPATLNLDSPAETIVAQMDYIGVEKMVLQNDHIYGNSADIFADAMTRFPDRFIGLAQVEEGFAWQDKQILRLESQVVEKGMSGLYFALSGFMRSGWESNYADPQFRPFWETVGRLKLPVFWVFPGTTPWGGFVEEMDRFGSWLEAFPDIPSVIVHGWPTALFDDGSGRIVWPETIQRIQSEHLVYSEILYPISWGRQHEFPYPGAVDHVRQFTDRFGADKLIWGADMPNVERYCTYRQSLDYILNACDFLSAEEKRAVFAETCLGLFPDADPHS